MAFTKRDISIDSLRGVAILLMVAGHVIGSSSDRGIGVSDDSIWRYFYLGLEDVRMPLFAALSGYVYSVRPINTRGLLPKLLKGKARRLLVPLISVGTIFFLVQLLVPGTNSNPQPDDLWKVYFFGFEHLWFVQATFLIFLMIGILDSLSILHSPRRWLLALGLTTVLFIVVSIPGDYDFFSATGAIRLAPFFLLGYGLRKFPGIAGSKRILVTCCALFIVAYGFRMAAVLTDNAPSSSAMRLLEISVGMTAVTALLLLRGLFKSKNLAWLGTYSFGIYLLHVFGSAGIRIVLDKVGIESHVPVFVICMIMAVGLPILFERTFGGVSWISWSILGQRPRAAKPAALP